MAVVFHPTEGERLPTREELKKENEMLRKQVEALEQQASFHENLFMELAARNLMRRVLRKNCAKAIFYVM